MLTNWKIRSKITLLAAILMFFILLIGGVGYSNLTKANKDMETMYKDRLLAIQQLDENQVHARAVEADIYYTILSTNNPQEQQAKLEDIRTRVEKFNENLTNESSSKIGEASNLIASIAEQTNLLALNAAIEAARAGEHGKGFAVVAEEIRKLAEQSTKSTQTIDDMVKDLQINSAEAVRTMEKFETILKEQVENVELTESKYKEISEAIEKAAEAVETINKAGKLMEEKKKEVLDTIQTLSAVAEENAASTEEASASIEEQTASMNQIAHSSSKLSQLTQKLQTLIEKFKI